jgi:transcriptional regulator with XRE-family HTH domain
MKLSEKIYYYRKKHGKSQEELAEALDVSRQAVSKWETGESEPEIGKLRALASVFGVTVDFLLSDEGPREDATPAAEAPRETGARTWVDALPGVLRQLVSRYGWLAGVYLAVVGGIITLMGIALFLITGSMSNMMGGIEVMPGLGGGGYIPDNSLTVMQPSVPSGMFVPMYVMGGLFLVIGLGFTVTGIVIAVKLKKQGK